MKKALETRYPITNARSVTAQWNPCADDPGGGGCGWLEYRDVSLVGWILSLLGKMYFQRNFRVHNFEHGDIPCAFAKQESPTSLRSQGEPQWERSCRHTNTERYLQVSHKISEEYRGVGAYIHAMDARHVLSSSTTGEHWWTLIASEQNDI